MKILVILRYLMVVIAIIAILAAMLLPTLSQAQEKAKLSNCGNVQKQLATATMLYVDDNDGYVFKIWSGNYPTSIRENYGAELLIRHNYLPDGPDNNPYKSISCSSRIVTSGTYNTMIHYVMGGSNEYSSIWRFPTKKKTQKLLFGDVYEPNGTSAYPILHSKSVNWILLDGSLKVYNHPELTYISPSLVGYYFYTPEYVAY